MPLLRIVIDKDLARQHLNRYTPPQDPFGVSESFLENFSVFAGSWVDFWREQRRSSLRLYARLEPFFLRGDRHHVPEVGHMDSHGQSINKNN